MKDNIDYKIFFVIENKKLTIVAYNYLKKQTIYKKELITKFNTNNIEPFLIQSFLDENVYEIEKILDNFINNIYLIIENENFFSIKISLKKNNYGDLIDNKKLNYLISEAKNQCEKTIDDRKIVHIIIDSYLIDGKIFLDLPDNVKCDFFSLNLNIICLSNGFLKNLEEIFKKYQISITQIINHSYLLDFQKLNNTNDIFDTAVKILNGLNKNEVFITNKRSKNKGFFEKFFFFFN